MARVTRDDVARTAGTSTAVVSYVINDGPRPVAAATRARVLAAVEELGYRPNRVAQAMARRRSDLIGMVVPDARQPFFAELAHTVERAAAERGKLVLIGNSDYANEREAHYIRAFLGMQVDGLILVTQDPSAPGVARADAPDGTPVVLLHHRAETEHGLAVVADDEGGAREVVGHLLGHGHATVHCFGGTFSLSPSDPVTVRTAGWAAALAAAGLTTEGRLVGAPFDRVRAHREALALLARAARPTAVFCATDDQAIGLLRAADDLGLRVPEDVAVAGFDDIAEAVIAGPPLTSVATAQEEMARAAVDLVLGARADGEPTPTTGARMFPARMVVRRSCGCTGA
ncbi:LacI family DNA-binding transcriptional regulator [Kitasatospora purpeofusca]|uniref:LacI family DNA-binding transcriptional regulator n=1 Tax=Kitasatospora purpeofusca TaxID=67352 RepID=UPI0022588F9F|nr:LacI family DNA-binding transcriptional regulator [Kitasatospora purpeofusca]MCX4757971.1 LacI family transcriptional regulator [Kitasatospora purpeofusca]WSR31546.1 LacI family transcriptional regulator [Kitasatospora purpeofusca]WSR39571.1 LacI family transcriptional regulator [Kitasatospora purpeofusca]